MYRQELPSYASFIELLNGVNHRLPGNSRTAPPTPLEATYAIERHGAIRVGTAQELSTLRRLFAIMGMYPVAYYDLSEAGLPVHSTAFRPITLNALSICPLRIFTSLLRLDLITDSDLHALASGLLDTRNPFDDRLLELIALGERQNGLSDHDADELLTHALDVFRWHDQARTDLNSYQRFHANQPLIADIVCFRGPHINHLTPHTLDIDEVQLQLRQSSLPAKAIIEGPPRRRNPILLRQTSFRAVEEVIRFPNPDGSCSEGRHSARFGEVEQRGIALTPKGRQLYDSLLAELRQSVPSPEQSPELYQQQLERIFSRFPDEPLPLHEQRLAYFYYQAEAHRPIDSMSLDQLVREGVLSLQPIVYEDFLPISAAGIFRSNLGADRDYDLTASPNQQAFESALGCTVLDPFELYARSQHDSLSSCLQELGLNSHTAQALLAQLTH
jgi:uncharacterized glyoxalase superfamily metalloenzyme YdcJ